MKADFDATVDFERGDALETELSIALARLQSEDADTSIVGCFVSADGERACLLSAHDSIECGEHDWYVIGHDVSEIAAKLRSLL